MDNSEIILHILRRIDAKLDAMQDSMMELEASMTNIEAAVASLAASQAAQKAPPTGLDRTGDASGHTGQPEKE